MNTLFAHPSAQHDDNNSVDFCRYHVAFVNSVVLVKLANRCVYAPIVRVVKRARISPVQLVLELDLNNLKFV